MNFNITPRGKTILVALCAVICFAGLAMVGAADSDELLNETIETTNDTDELNITVETTDEFDHENETTTVDVEFYNESEFANDSTDAPTVLTDTITVDDQNVTVTYVLNDTDLEHGAEYRVLATGNDTLIESVEIDGDGLVGAGLIGSTGAASAGVVGIAVVAAILAAIVWRGQRR